MSNRALPFDNDNIRTGHLKCDRCNTRNSLQGIERSLGFENRMFGCAHCGAIKTVRIDTSDTIAASL